MRNNVSRIYVLILTRKKNTLKEMVNITKTSQKTFHFFYTKRISYIRIFLRACSLLNTTITYMYIFKINMLLYQ